MEELKSYIKTDDLKLSEKDKKILLKLDKEYGKFFKEFWIKWDRTDCKNLKEEYKKFMDARKKGEKYFPQIELVVDKLDDRFLLWARKLKMKFLKFPCYLSQFYVENIDFLEAQAAVTVRKGNKEALALNNYYMCPPVSEENYKAAWKMLKENPLKDVTDVQNYTGKDIVDMMQKHIDKLGYKHKVVLNPYMVARQNVVPYEPILHIKTDGKFSDIDVASLKVHEVEVHVARRYYGAQTGLNLFLDGLAERNTTDEGMAIYQSLHHNPKGVKPNLKFMISIKTVIGYHIMDMDFCELYDWLLPQITTEANKNIVEFILFKNLIRFKRIVRDTSLPGGDAISETDYFCGYQYVKDMTDEEKDDLIKYNVGPNHVKDIPQIKKFFKLNKFEPLI